MAPVLVLHSRPAVETYSLGYDCAVCVYVCVGCVFQVMFGCVCRLFEPLVKGCLLLHMLQYGGLVGYQLVDCKGLLLEVKPTAAAEVQTAEQPGMQGAAGIE